MTAQQATATRLFLSPPAVGHDEHALVADALASGWVTPLGPHVDAFEAELAATCGVGHVAALSSGTAAIHLALHLLGVGPGDDVLVSTLTFIATANPVTYLGARPVFVDSERASWNLDPDLLAHALHHRARHGRPPKALVVVDLFGQCADYDQIVPLCAEHGVAVVEDAAEALGATHRGRPAGSFGTYGVLSFNGNKIITTGGGGALLGDDAGAIARARWLGSQAREPAAHYEHREVGFNYRLSNVSAALGRGQLRTLHARVERRHAVNARYRSALAELPGVAFAPVAPWGRPNHWLTCLTVDPAAFGADREDVRLHLAAHGVEARPAWKPLHRQPVFAGCEVVGGDVADEVFATGLCLPSGPALTDADVDLVADLVTSTPRRRTTGTHR